MLRTCLFLTLFLMLACGPAAAGAEDVRPAGTDTISTVRSAPIPLAVLPAWSEAAIEALAIALFDAPGHGLPSLDRTAEDLLDRSLPHEHRAAMATRAFLRFGAWLRYGLMDSQTQHA